MQTFIEYEKRDLQIGLFVLLGLIVVTTVVLLKIHWDTNTYTITAEFSRISNVNEATKVRLRGYEIGHVKKIRFYPEPSKPGVYFRLDLAIQDRYPLFQGTRAEIRGGGLLGDRWISLEASGKPGARLKSGAVIPGTLPDDLGETLEGARDMMHSVSRMARRMDDADIGGKFALFVLYIRRIADDVDRLSYSGSEAFGSVNRTFSDLHPELARAVERLNGDLDRADRVMGNADSILVENRGQLRMTMESIRVSMAHLQVLISSADSLTTGSREDLQQTIRNLKDATGSLKDLSKHPWKIFSGKIK